MGRCLDSSRQGLIPSLRLFCLPLRNTFLGDVKRRSLVCVPVGRRDDPKCKAAQECAVLETAFNLCQDAIRICNTRGLGDTPRQLHCPHFRPKIRVWLPRLVCHCVQSQLTTEIAREDITRSYPNSTLEGKKLITLPSNRVFETSH